MLVSLFAGIILAIPNSNNCSNYINNAVVNDVVKDTIKTEKTDVATVKTAKDSTKVADKKKLPYKPYKEVITNEAKTRKGLFTVHQLEDKYYFEIPDSLMNTEFLAVTRFSKVPGGASRYGGEETNEQTFKFIIGPKNNIFLKLITIISLADSTQTISKAVQNSYLDPIVANFEIKTVGKDSSSWVIDVTDFFKGDNQVVGLTSFDKSIFNLLSLSSDRSYIESMKSFPLNTEIRTVKTYSTTPASSPFSPPIPGRFPLTPAAANAGALTFEINTSLILLPRKPMLKRLFDARVGYFADNYVIFSDQQQKTKDQVFAIRHRLEPKPEDAEKYKRGELVEPAKQIVYYIDPATPKQWVPYLIQGINDWQKAFEKAGFKNAIVGKEWPANDSTMSLEDARFCVLRYFASDIQNAYGPQVHDPRTGEILESHIGWYHNVMKLLHNWYFIQTAAVDPQARKMEFDEKLMGQLIRFVSSHEVGHTLGLRHNMGSSSKTSVEKLRDKAWVEANGHTASIMDYARFNYVAQPEDNISQKGLFPKIGEYDDWAIEWGYKYTGINNPDSDYKYMNKIVISELKKNQRLWFGGESFNNDPRAQTEDLGDNSVKASEYGVKNLKFILNNLSEWTKEEGDQYENLYEMYNQVVSQYNRYVGHVIKNIGGIYETFKSVEEPGDVYESTPKAIQKQAMAFLQSQLFATPLWLLNKDVLNKFSQPNYFERIQTIQVNTISSLNDPNRLYRLVACTERFGAKNTYTLSEMLNDVRTGIFSELNLTEVKIDNYRRYEQKILVDKWITIIKESSSTSVSLPSGFSRNPNIPLYNTDIPSEIKAQLRYLEVKLPEAINKSNDAATKNHLTDLKERIYLALHPR